ncbi:TonB-dependent receptor [Bowmanella yangjiangensis]|uniref:TonB-dependent receptor n=1 Tax=Bowmanella yangjiangensis TaxID=2811230 RepID=A0ABS3CTG5_9ALTE|nr:TonB-dependent receptor [Bowmanella yangjiangensis]MBN7820413.1 TonB-dependent receptor [Bowmanella yangjiangensis]
MLNKELKRTALSLAISGMLGISLMQYAGTAMAANNDGAIHGTVSNEMAEHLQDAQVTIVDKATGIKRSVTVKSDGRFRFPRLPIGSYEITVQKNGYETLKLDNVSVGIGNATTLELTMTSGDVEVISVSGARIAMIDTTSTESALNISALELERLPVARSINSVALLAPGTAGGGRHGGLSFGGASGAENAVFINGLNVTDPELPTSYSSVPFSFYKDFQIKTGGYSAEFGRTTGGVVNAVVKSGTNQFEFGADVYYSPDALRGDGKNTYDKLGRKVVNRENDSNDSLTASVYAAGPIIEDKLFFFALYEPRLVQSDSWNSTDTHLSKYEDDSGFWGGKLDWYITDDHLLEFIAFSDESDGTTDIIKDGVLDSTTLSSSGGKNYIATYTGHFSEDFVMKAMYGELERQYRSNATTALECNRVMDYTKLGPIFDLSCTSLGMTDDRINKRESMRLDFEWNITDAHLLRFGMDYETRITQMDRAYPGTTATRYEIRDVVPGGSLNGETLSDEYDYYVRARTRKTFGNFETETSAFYVEDIWSVTDTITLTLGARYDEFDTTGAGGTGFMKVDGMFSPRAGFAWDVSGDGETKVFANLGRYYYPLPNSLVAREGGGTVDVSNYYYMEGGLLVDGVWQGGFTENVISTGQTNLTPNLGPIIGEAIEFGAVEAAEDQSYRIDNDLEASFQDEVILGMETMLNQDWRLGGRLIYRKFENAVEDMKVYRDWGDCNSPGTWLIGNPGKVISLQLECNGQMQTVEVDLGKEQIQAGHAQNKTDQDIGSPVPFRKYGAMELVLEKQWDDLWSFYGSYTWAHSWGNYEGGVNSDTTNNVAGWLEYGDDPMYLVGGYGNLPNDVRHQFKLRGAYAVTDQWTISSSLNMSSGRPLNVRGVGNPYTEDEHYYMNWVCVENCAGDDSASRVYNAIPRGSYGRTDWLISLDARLSYKTQIAGMDTRVSLDVFNVFNTQVVTRTDQFLTEVDSVGIPNDDFGVATALQGQRSMQLSASIRF